MTDSSLVDLATRAVDLLRERRQELIGLQRQMHERQREFEGIRIIHTDRSHAGYLPVFNALLCASIAHAYSSRDVLKRNVEGDKSAIKDYLAALKTIKGDVPPRYKDKMELMMNSMDEFPRDVSTDINRYDHSTRQSMHFQKHRESKKSQANQFIV